MKWPRDDFEIIVVDNGSTDRTLDIARKLANKALFFPEGNVGAVRNHGASFAQGEILAFIDADCVVGHGWLADGIELLKRNPGAVLGGPCKPRQGANWIEEYWLLKSNRSSVIQKDLLGSCIFIHRSDFMASGGFNEIMTSGEDSDFSQKLRQLGKEIIIKNELAVVHLGNPNTTIDFLKRQIWHAENYLLFPRNSIKDATFWLVLLFLASAVGLLFNLTNSKLAILWSFPLIAIPAIFSLKRLSRAGFPKVSFKGLARIYIIDLFYLLGRSAGLVKSSTRMFRKFK